MPPVWFQTPNLKVLNDFGRGTMVEHLGIDLTEAGDDFLKGTMPVDHRTKQPHGLLHGGASVVLAESLGSIAANLVVDYDKFYCVGLDINANHIQPVRDGFVTGVARPVHLGRTTQVWEIKIQQSDKLVCVSRLTMAVLAKKH